MTPSSQSSEVDVLRLQIDLARAQTELARASGPHCLSGQLGGLGDSQFSLSSLAYCTKLLPVFNEEQPDDFFVAFQRTARNAGWPRHTWPLLQHRLVGKAQSTHTALSDEEARD